MITQADFIIFQGTVEHIQVTVTDDAGVIKSIAASQSYIRIGDLRTPTTYLHKVCTLVTDGSDGKLQVTLTEANTLSLPAKKCDYQVVVVDADGDIQVVRRGMFDIQIMLPEAT